MPELPEVETTRRGIEPHVTGARMTELIVRRRDLRQPVSENIMEIEGRKILSVARRPKYLLLEIDDGSTLLVHLAMSGMRCSASARRIGGHRISDPRRRFRSASFQRYPQRPTSARRSPGERLTPSGCRFARGC